MEQIAADSVRLLNILLCLFLIPVLYKRFIGRARTQGNQGYVFSTILVLVSIIGGSAESIRARLDFSIWSVVLSVSLIILLIVCARDLSRERRDK